MHRIDLGLTRVDWLMENLDALSGIDCAPVPLVNGDDLQNAGFSPGPLFKRVLEEVYDAQLESRVLNKAGAMELAVQLASQK